MSALPAREPRRRPRRPPLEIIEPPRRRHTLRFAILVLAIGGALVFGAVTLNALAAADAVAARDLEAQVTQGERDYAALIARIAELEDPARIRRIATDELGMVPARAPRFLDVLRPLPADGYVADLEAGADDRTDPLKPVLSVER